MHRILSAFISMVTLAACSVGCQHKPPVMAQRIKTLSPSDRPANSAGLSAEEINAGAKLFLTKCARCHALYDPNQYTDVEFSRWMTKMSKKSHLKSEQEQLLSRYLGAFRNTL